MFDSVRKHSKLMMGLMFLLIIPSFVLFGIEGYSRFNEQGNAVARVDGNKITQTEWDNAHRREVERIRAANPNADLKQLDSPQAKYATLERLVRDRVIAAAATREHLVTTDAQLAQALNQDPTLASFRKADGSMDMERYRQALAAQGMTPESFEAGVRSDMSGRQVLGGVVASGLTAPAQADVALGAYLERRAVQVTRLQPADYASKVSVTDADLESYYKQNVARFQSPEQVSVEYVVLDMDSVKKGVSVNEQDVKTYYEQNQNRFGTREERRASHILVAAPSGAPAAEREQAKTKAQALLDEVRKAPERFAEVAKRASADDVSAPNGGDLGYFEREKGTEPAIAKAAFEQAKGAISALVESPFGYHIVYTVDVKPASVPPFEQVRAKIEEELRTQQAQRKFGELAETFGNSVYEQADSLKPVADKLGLQIRTQADVKRVPAQGATGPFANERFVSALFSSDSLQKKRNTEAIDIGNNQLVSGRVANYSPAAARPFADVKDEVRRQVVNDRAADLARKDGEARLAAWRAQPPVASSTPPVLTISRREPQNQSPRVIEAALRADASKLPAFTGVDLGAEGYALVRIDQVLPRDASAPDTLVAGRREYDQMWGNAEALAYYNQLKARFKAEILAPKPDASALAAAAPARAASR